MIKKKFYKYWPRWQFAVAGAAEGLMDGSHHPDGPPKEILTIFGMFTILITVFLILLTNAAVLIVAWIKRESVNDFELEDLEDMFPSDFIKWVKNKMLIPYNDHLYEEYLYYKYIYAGAMIHHDFNNEYKEKIDPQLNDMRHDAYRDHIIVKIAGLSNVV